MDRGYDFKRERFRDLRVRTGMTQGEFAIEVEMSKSQINRLEKGGHIPYMKTITRLARGLGVDRDELIQYDTDPRVSPENVDKLGGAQQDWEENAEDQEDDDEGDDERGPNDGGT